MIELMANPEALNDADDGDKFLLNGREVIVCESTYSDCLAIYLTAADSPGYHDAALARRLQESDLLGEDPAYGDVWVHVRPVGDSTAVRTVRQMIDLIKSGAYEFV